MNVTSIQSLFNLKDDAIKNGTINDSDDNNVAFFL